MTFPMLAALLVRLVLLLQFQLLCFFFQAEDGIRDYKVTGVQTCALPIYFIGRCLVAVERDSVAHLPGNVQVVTEGDFVGVVADREEQAIAAMRALRVQWQAVPPAPDLSDLAAAIRANPAQHRALVDQEIGR